MLDVCCNALEILVIIQARELAVWKTWRSDGEWSGVHVFANLEKFPVALTWLLLDCNWI